MIESKPQNEQQTTVDDYHQTLPLIFKENHIEKIKVGEIYSIHGKSAILITQVDQHTVKALFVALDSTMAHFRDLCVNIGSEEDPRLIFILDQSPLIVLKSNLQALLYTAIKEEDLKQALFLLQHPKTSIKLIDSYDQGLYLWSSEVGYYIAGPKLMPHDPRYQERQTFMLFYEQEKKYLAQQVDAFEHEQQRIHLKLARLYENFDSWSQNIKDVFESLVFVNEDVVYLTQDISMYSMVTPLWLNAFKEEAVMPLQYRSLTKKTKLINHVYFIIQINPFEMKIDFHKAKKSMKQIMEEIDISLQFKEEEIYPKLDQHQWIFQLEKYQQELLQLDEIQLKIMDKIVCIPLYM